MTLPPVPIPQGRTVTLRREVVGADSRNLWAFIDQIGDLHINGQDLGPGTAMVSSDGEYEWFRTIRKVDQPRLVELLGAGENQPILDTLEAEWSGAQSYDLEKLLRDSDIDTHLGVWSG